MKKKDVILTICVLFIAVAIITGVYIYRSLCDRNGEKSTEDTTSGITTPYISDDTSDASPSVTDDGVKQAGTGERDSISVDISGSDSREYPYEPSVSGEFSVIPGVKTEGEALR